MTTTTYSDLHIRLDKEIKTEAEAILKDYGISPSTAINIFYHQVIEHEGLPFAMRRKHTEGLADFDSLSREDVDLYIKKAQEEITQGKHRPADAVFREILGEDYEKI